MKAFRSIRLLVLGDFKSLFAFAFPPGCEKKRIAMEPVGLVYTHSMVETDIFS